jgi:hypothetical protein
VAPTGRFGRGLTRRCAAIGRLRDLAVRRFRRRLGPRDLTTSPGCVGQGRARLGDLAPRRIRLVGWGGPGNRLPTTRRTTHAGRGPLLGRPGRRTLLGWRALIGRLSHAPIGRRRARWRALVRRRPRLSEPTGLRRRALITRRPRLGHPPTRRCPPARLRRRLSQPGVRRTLFGWRALIGRRLRFSDPPVRRQLPGRRSLARLRRRSTSRRPPGRRALIGGRARARLRATGRPLRSGPVGRRRRARIGHPGRALIGRRAWTRFRATGWPLRSGPVGRRRRARIGHPTIRCRLSGPARPRRRLGNPGIRRTLLGWRALIGGRLRLGNPPMGRQLPGRRSLARLPRRPTRPPRLVGRRLRLGHPAGRALVGRRARARFRATGRPLRSGPVGRRRRARVGHATIGRVSPRRGAPVGGRLGDLAAE